MLVLHWSALTTTTMLISSPEYFQIYAPHIRFQTLMKTINYTLRSSFLFQNFTAESCMCSMNIRQQATHICHSKEERYEFEKNYYNLVWKQCIAWYMYRYYQSALCTLRLYAAYFVLISEYQKTNLNLFQTVEPVALHFDIV